MRAGSAAALWHAACPHHCCGLASSVAMAHTAAAPACLATTRAHMRACVRFNHLHFQHASQWATSANTTHAALKHSQAALTCVIASQVLQPSASQHDVYMAGVRDVVNDVLQGYNGTVMAYGQTGACAADSTCDTHMSLIKLPAAGRRQDDVPAVWLPAP
jgi:hypothetical protein